jgi:hypothetical protein
MSQARFNRILTSIEDLKKLFEEEINKSKSMNYFSKLVNVDRAYIHKYLNGKKNISVERMIDLLQKYYASQK